MTRSIRLYPVHTPEECPNRMPIEKKFRFIPFIRYICASEECNLKECKRANEFPLWCPLLEIEDDRSDD